MIKKASLICMLAFCLLFAACGSADNAPKPETTGGAEAAQPAPAVTVKPLADTTMENLADAIFAVSLEEGGAYLDDSGKMQLEVTIYTYDKYDMVDIAGLKEGDILVTHAGQTEVTSLSRSETGILYINGGLEEGGFDLVTNDEGIFFETGFNDAKTWYEVGRATIPVSPDFTYHDNSDPDKGETVFYPGDFLTEGVVDFGFNPHSTTLRVEAGQAAEMHRIFVP